MTTISDQIKKAIFEAVKATFPEVDLQLTDISLEHPTVEEHGDFSTNIAMKLKMGNPSEVAEKIVNKINEVNKIN